MEGLSDMLCSVLVWDSSKPPWFWAMADSKIPWPSIFVEQQDGCIVCPSTESTYDLKTGKVRDWMPSNPVLRVLTPSLRDLQTYSVKIESDSIYINVAGKTGESAEIVFGGTTQAGKTATNVDVDEVTIQFKVYLSECPVSKLLHVKKMKNSNFYWLNFEASLKQYLAILQMFHSTATICYHCLILIMWCTGSFICKGGFTSRSWVQKTWSSNHPLIDLTVGLKIGFLN